MVLVTFSNWTANTRGPHPWGYVMTSNSFVPRGRPVLRPLPADPFVAAVNEAVHVLPTTRVLVAEDHPVNQRVFSSLLGLFGLEPTIVDNGAQAVLAWERSDWDVILMDIQMPEMDGVTAARMIRAREAETGRPRIPIIAITANISQRDVEAYRDAGMDDLVAKPIEFPRLVEAMERAVGRAQPESEPAQPKRAARSAARP